MNATQLRWFAVIVPVIAIGLLVECAGTVLRLAVPIGVFEGVG